MLEKNYDPKKYEQEIYTKWEKNGVFKPKNNSNKNTHINILPPPNANGSLHLGHASGYSIMDIAGRYARMQGKETLLLPGKDHAGILTQVVFEKKLLAEKGISRHDLGREEFFKQCYNFCTESADIMRAQEKRIGLSADWAREKFTLDPEISKEVLETFVQMYKDGLAYKGERIINWCPHCQTALSDMEVKYNDQVTKFYWIKYGPFVLATARPETKLGDTAVAVHPDDARYKHMIGKKYTIQGAIGEFEIIVVGDEAVDPNFGSGAVKVTPAHSFVDFEIAKRHNITAKMVINKEGKMMENCGKYAGMTTMKCRQAIVADLQAMGLIEKIEENYQNKISVHDRCGHVIEPLISDQWWINTDHPKFSLKKEAIKAVQDGRIKIEPKSFEKTYFHWMENLQDWCISRQLWWGHQIPAFYCQDCGQMDVSLGEKTEIYYMRHGETDLNKLGKFQGSSENPSLNETGVNQVKAKIAEIKQIKPDVILTSPLKRAQESAQIIAEALNLPVIIEPKLIERDFGICAGQSIQEIMAKNNVKQVQELHFIDYPEGESCQKNVDRLKLAFDEIQAKYAGKKVLIVAHGANLRVLRVTEKQMTKTASLAYEIPNTYIEKFTRYTPFTKCSKCNSTNIKQDEDTFDTWFSSGQWAHTTVNTFGENNYFPGDFMVMGRDIIFFWNCRMIMMSLYSTGQVPYKNLYLTGLIRDKNGDKMSKSKGNGIDPLEMCDKYGTDALRLSLFIGSSAGNDMRLYEEKIASYRNFVNKLWNASRFVQIVETQKVETQNLASQQGNLPSKKILSEIDKWILTSLNNLIIDVTKSLDNYHYSEAGQKIYDFTWNEFCDWYLELSKGELQNITVLKQVLQNLLILLHPFIPFVTEALWLELGFLEESKTLLAQTAWCLPNLEWNYLEATNNTAKLINIVTTIRSIRASQKIDPACSIVVAIKTNLESIKILKELGHDIVRLARLGRLEISTMNFGLIVEEADQLISQVISDDITVYVSLSGTIDKEQEQKRMMAELAESEKKLTNLENRLTSPGYKEKAPANLIAQTEKEKLELEAKIEQLKKLLS